MAYEDDDYVDEYEPEVTPSGGEDDWEPQPAPEEPPPLPRERPSAEEQEADEAENAPPYQVAGAPQPPPKPAEDDWEPMPEGGFKPSETKTTTAKPARDDWEPMPEGGFKPEKAEEPRGLTERIVEGIKGGMGAVEDPETHERKLQLGIPRETLEKYPFLRPLQQYAVPFDVLTKAPGGLIGGAAGLIAGLLERNPDALLPYGVDRQTADQIQRNLRFMGEAGLAEVGSRIPAARDVIPTRPRLAPADVPPGSPIYPPGQIEPARPLPEPSPVYPERQPPPAEPPRQPGEPPHGPSPVWPDPGSPVWPGGAEPPPRAPPEQVSPVWPPTVRDAVEPRARPGELPGVERGRVEPTQTEMPLYPPTPESAAPRFPRQEELLPPAGEQGQLPLPHEQAPTVEGKTQRHGSPGAEAAAGTAEEKAPPPRELDLTAAKGPEDYGKKPQPSPVYPSEGGMNVGEVDPTLAHALRSEPRTAPAETAPPAAAAAARPAETVRGPIPEIPGGAQKPGGNIVRPLEERPTGELIQLARRGELSPFMRDSLSNELERRGIRRMPEPARPEPPNVGAQLRAREEAARRATQEAAAPGPARQFLRDERGGGRLPIRRSEIERGRDGRPIRTAPLPIGTEPRILQRGYERATGPRLPPEQAPPFRQAVEREGPKIPSPSPALLRQAERAAAARAARQAPPLKAAEAIARSKAAEAPKTAAPLTPPSPTTVSRLTEKIKTPEALTKVAEAWKRTFQPEAISELARKADPQFAKYASAKAGEIDRIVRNSLKDERFWEKQTPEKQLKFMSDVENKRPVDPDLRQYEGRVRKMLDEAHAAEKEWGSKAGYIEDYFPHIWEKPKEAMAAIQQRIATLGPTWFQKARTIDLIEEGIKAGFELKTTNPEALVRDRLISGADMRMKMQLLNDLKDMNLAGKVAGEENVAGLKRMGWQELNAPDRERWMIAPDVAHLWKNAVESRGLWANQGLAGDAFRGWMGLKNVWVPVKLAASAFHPLHVYHINMSSSLARAADQAMAGHFNDAVKSFGQAFSPYSSKGKMGRAQWLLGEAARTEEGKAAVKTMEEGGFNPMLSEQLRIDAGKKLQQSWNKMNPFSPAHKGPQHALPAAYHGMRYAVQQIQSPIFEHWIPHLKTAAYLEDAAALLKRQPELLNDPVNRGIALRQVAKSIDNRFGEMFYSGLFWNRYVKDAGIGSFLSLGWNLGFVREFGGAAAELATRPAGRLLGQSEARQVARDATNKIKFASIYLGSAALIGGIMTKLFTGEDPKDTTDYIFPRMGGTNPDGSPRRMTTMFYLREGPMFMKHMQERGGGVGGAVSGGLDMIYSKMLFSPFVELAKNRSYFGKEIYDPDAPAFQQLKQVGMHILREQTAPMSVTGMQRNVATGADSAVARAMPFLGFGPAPSYAEKSAIQNQITHLYQEHVAPGKRPYEDPEVSKGQLDARNNLLMARQSGDKERIATATKEAFQAGLSAKYIATIGREFGDQKMFKRLPQSDQMHLLERASPEEQARYWPYTSNKTKLQWMKENPGWKMPQVPKPKYAEGGEVEEDDEPAEESIYSRLKQEEQEMEEMLSRPDANYEDEIAPFKPRYKDI